MKFRGSEMAGDTSKVCNDDREIVHNFCLVSRLSTQMYMTALNRSYLNPLRCKVLHGCTGFFQSVIGGDKAQVLVSPC